MQNQLHVRHHARFPSCMLLPLCILLLLFSSIHAEHQPIVHIFNTPAIMGEICARKLADHILENQKLNRQTVLGLATGSTPILMYKAFNKIVKEENLDLSQLITFNLDEYLGLPPEHPQSYHCFMFTHLFAELLQSSDNPLGIKPENIHIPKGCAKTKQDLTSEELALLFQKFPEKENNILLTAQEELWILQQRAKEYDALLLQLGPIDIQILGIGTNGHIGFAEPGSVFSDGTSLIRLADSTRKDNARFFNDDISAVPQYAITMGVGTVLKANAIFLLATGSHKAPIINKMLKDPISTAIPATALRLHPQVTVFLDKKAAANLEKYQDDQNFMF